MAALRRAPKTPNKPKLKAIVPLHRRILGVGATELDTIDDLRLELERAHGLDLMEFDTYLDCCEALDIREAKARIAIQKAVGSYVKPDKKVYIKTKTVVRRSHGLSMFQKKILVVVIALIVFKMFT